MTGFILIGFMIVTTAVNDPPGWYAAIGIGLAYAMGRVWA